MNESLLSGEGTYARSNRINAAYVKFLSNMTILPREIQTSHPDQSQPWYADFHYFTEIAQIG